MFTADDYRERRNRLISVIPSGVAVFLGNTLSPRESRDNCHVFHQDSSFLYYFGIDLPDLGTAVDAETPSLIRVSANVTALFTIN